MGSSISSFWGYFTSFQIGRVLILGLDGVGKTTILYKIKQGETVYTIPTIGFNVEEVEYKGVKITMWDIGGQDKIRALWRHYYENVQCIIYVVDSTDDNPDRINQNIHEIQLLCQEPELKDAKLLVLANKQDLKGAATPFEVSKRLNLYDIDKKWHILPCCACSAAGLRDSMNWVVSVLTAAQS